MNNQFSRDQGDEERNHQNSGDDVEDLLRNDKMDTSDVEEPEKPENGRFCNLSSKDVDIDGQDDGGRKNQLELDCKIDEPRREPIQYNNHPKIVQLFNNNVSSNQPIFVSLTHHDQWAKLHSIGHEMKVARRGRILSPPLEYNIVGLHPFKVYSMALHFERMDNDKCLRWSTKQSPPGYIEIQDNRHIVNPVEIPHPFGPQIGLLWMMKSFGFEKLRLTNIEQPNDDYNTFVLITTGHRYMPVLIIRESTGIVHTVRIPHTEFHTVMVFHKNETKDIKWASRIKRNNSATAPSASSSASLLSFVNTQLCTENPTAEQIGSLQQKLLQDQNLMNEFLSALLPNLPAFSQVFASILLSHANPNSNSLPPPHPSALPTHATSITSSSGAGVENKPTISRKKMKFSIADILSNN